VEARPDKSLPRLCDAEGWDALDLPDGGGHGARRSGAGAARTPHIIALPGHSPGSIAVHVPLADAIFVGDALTTRHVLTGQVGPQPAPFTDDPAQALASLGRLEKIQATWVLPGHGAPWSGGVQKAVEAVLAAATPSV